MTGPKKILLLDDEPDLLLVLAAELEQEGYFAVPMASKSDGFDWSIRNQPDLILSDIKSPGMDGFQLLKCLKSNPRTSWIPFIFVTGNASLQIAVEAKRLGASDFITKPYELLVLLSVITTVLNGPVPPTSASGRSLVRIQSAVRHLPWQALKRRVVSALESGSQRSAVLEIDDLRWRIHVVFEGGRRLVGGLFNRPYEGPEYPLEDVLAFRAYLDSKGLTAGLALSFSIPSPSVRSIARLLGITFLPMKKLERLVNISRRTSPPQPLLTRSEVMRISLQKPNEEFQYFVQYVLSTIRRRNGDIYEVAYTSRANRVKLVQQEHSTGGFIFVDNERRTYEWIPLTAIWHSLHQLWVTGVVKTEALGLKSPSQAIVTKMLERSVGLRGRKMDPLSFDFGKEV